MKAKASFSALGATFLVVTLALTGCSSEDPSDEKPPTTKVETTAPASPPALSVAVQVTEALESLANLEAVQISSSSTTTETAADKWIQVCTVIDAKPVAKELSVSRTPDSAIDSNTKCDPAATSLLGMLLGGELISPARPDEAPVPGKWERTALPEAISTEAFESITGLTALKDAIQRAGGPVETGEKTAGYDIARADLDGLAVTEMQGALVFDQESKSPFRVTITMDDESRIASYEIIVDTEESEGVKGTYKIVRSFTYDAPKLEAPAGVSAWNQPPVTDAFDALFRMALVS